MHLLPALVTTPSLTAADLHDPTAMQTQLMSLVLAENLSMPLPKRDRTRRYLQTTQDWDDNPCLWNGVECENGIMQSFVFMTPPSEKAQNWRIKLDWLPATLQTVHIREVSMIDGWLAERLPSALRYISLQQCHLSYERPRDIRELNFRNFPVGLEELYMTGCSFRGSIVLDALPPNLRLCALQCPCIRRVLLDASKLPGKMEKLVISKSVDVTEAYGEKLDRKVVSRRYTEISTLSEKYAECEALLKSMQRAYTQARLQGLRERLQR